jgi:hypothetical protein
MSNTTIKQIPITEVISILFGKMNLITTLVAKELK